MKRFIIAILLLILVFLSFYVIREKSKKINQEKILKLKFEQIK